MTKDGLIDIDDAAAAGKVTPEQMRDTGFVGGASGEWIESDRTWVGIILYQFDGPESAAAWTESTRESFESNDVFPAGVPIRGVPDGMVYARNTISGNGRWFAEAVFAKGDISIELFVTGPVRHGPRKATSYAIAQYARLP